MKPEAIELLEHVRLRPTMYFGTPSEKTVQDFMCGFGLACIAFGVPMSLETNREATYKRGWGFPAIGPASEMRERGYTKAQVVDELLMIEITELQLLAALQECSE